MEFDKTRWSCPWNNDQNCTQNSAGVLGVKRSRGRGSRGGRGEGGLKGGWSRVVGGLGVVGVRGEGV